MQLWARQEKEEEEMTYKVQLRISQDGRVDVDIDTKVDAKTPMQALGKFLRDCQQVPKALDAVDPKNPYREPA